MTTSLNPPIEITILLHRLSWRVTSSLRRGFSHTASVSSKRTHLMWRWQTLHCSSHTYFVSPSIALQLRLSIFLYVWLSAPAVNKNLNNKMLHPLHIHPHTHCCTTMPARRTFFDLWCIPSPHPIITSDSNRHLCSQSSFFTFCLRKKTVLQQTHLFLTHRHTMMSVSVIFFGCWPRSPRLFTQHFYCS